MAERTRALRVTKDSITTTDDGAFDEEPGNGRSRPVRRTRRRASESDESVSSGGDEVASAKARRSRRRTPTKTNGRSSRRARDDAEVEEASGEAPDDAVAVGSAEDTSSDVEAKPTRSESPMSDKVSSEGASSEPVPAESISSDSVSTEPKAPAAEFASKLSDRAIQRITGGNAFLRGRIYARRNAVEGLRVDGDTAAAEIHMRNADEPYRPQIRLDEERKVVSSCTCPGWRGPANHCKHVAALLVALRDRERPPRPRPENQRKDKEKKGAASPVHVPQTVSVGGKRRRSRRRRRGATGDGQAIDVLSARELTGSQTQDRGQLDTWLPAEVLPKPYDFEYRLAVRSASIAGDAGPVRIADGRPDRRGARGV